MANNFFGAIALTGGGSGALDAISGNNIADGDAAFVVDAINNIVYIYTCVGASGAAESSPDIIAPDTSPGTKRWILVQVREAYIPSGVTNDLVTIDADDTIQDSGILITDVARRVGTPDVLNLCGMDADGDPTDSSLVVSTIVTLVGSQVLTNKTLTSPIINTILAKAGETGIAIAADGSVDLYHDNSKVFETHSNGVIVGESGAIASADFTVQGTAQAAVLLYDTGGSVDKKYGRMIQKADQLLLEVVNDAFTLIETYLACNPNGSVDLYHNNSAVASTGASSFVINGYLVMLERSSDPTEPTEGTCAVWMSDGTGKGNDGDILIASKAGGTTKYGTLFDHSAGAAW